MDIGTDFIIADHGSLLLLSPESEAAQSWLNDFVLGSDEVQTWGKAVVVEPRYIADILEGIVDEGLTYGVER